MHFNQQEALHAQGVPCYRGLSLGYRNANSLCSRKLPHPMQYWHKGKVQLQIRTRFTMFIGRTAKAAKSAFLLVFH